MIIDTIKQFLRRATDKVFEGRNRTRIVLGTDRKDVVRSGWGDGGENDLDSGTIDIVAGYVDENPDYIGDKSRIYVSGKTNPDEYFEIQVGQTVNGEPAVITISDNVYTVGRKKIKIVINEQTSILIDGNRIILNKGSNFITLDNTNISIGSQNPTDFMALANKCDAENRKIQLALNGLSNSAGSVVSASPYVPASVKSTRIKAD